jgi:hypothetical protein
LPPAGVRSCGMLQARTGPALRPTTNTSGNQVTGELLHLVLTELQAFELLALPARAPCRLPAPPRCRAGLGGPWALPLAGVRSCELLQAHTGPAPRPFASASGDQVAGELLHLVRIALQGFELLPLLAEAPRRLPAPPQRSVGLGGPWA